MRYVMGIGVLTHYKKSSILLKKVDCGRTGPSLDLPKTKSKKPTGSAFGQGNRKSLQATISPR